MVKEIIENRAIEHLKYVCYIAIPLWIAWIPFDYFFAGELFYDFIYIRILGSVSTIFILYLLEKKLLSLVILQCLLFLYFTSVLSYMLILTDDALDVYFQAYSMIFMFTFFILILRPIELIIYTAMGILSFLSVLYFNSLGALFVLGNGGYVFLTVVLVMLSIGMLRYKGVLRDAVITESIKKAEEVELLNKSLEISVKEKETLLQEVHHRVKNNMQVISSILSLQNSYVKDDFTQKVLKDSISRIRSMSNIHERLYKFKNFASINFADYFLDLTSEVIASYKNNADLEIKVNHDFEDLRLCIKQAIPCGLIINEIVTNAVKYAFQEEKIGEISLQLSVKNNKVCIIIKDDGVGLPDGFSMENTNSLGLQLVDSLVEQLEGKLEMLSLNGVSFKFEFQLDMEIENEFKDLKSNAYTL